LDVHPFLGTAVKYVVAEVMPRGDVFPIDVRIVSVRV
jgi:hypothetical protein